MKLCSVIGLLNMVRRCETDGIYRYIDLDGYSFIVIEYSLSTEFIIVIFAVGIFPDLDV